MYFSIGVAAGVLVGCTIIAFHESAAPAALSVAFGGMIGAWIDNALRDLSAERPLEGRMPHNDRTTRFNSRQ